MKWEHGIKDFMTYSRLERSLADNTLKAYRRDLEKLIKWLSDNEITQSPIHITTNTVRDYIYELAKKRVCSISSACFKQSQGLFQLFDVRRL